jgi:hypothetical protein
MTEACSRSGTLSFCARHPRDRTIENVGREIGWSSL